jgi:hypothetical protein
MASFTFGVTRVPTNVPQTENYEPGMPFEGVTLPLYHHPTTYNTALKNMQDLFRTLRIDPDIIEGGNIVVCFGPDGGINAFRA